MAQLAESSAVFPRSEIVHIQNGTRMPDVPNATMDRAEAKRSLGLSPDRPAAGEHMGHQGAQWVRQTCDMRGYLYEVVKLYERVLRSAQTAGAAR